MFENFIFYDIGEKNFLFSNKTKSKEFQLNNIYKINKKILICVGQSKNKELFDLKN